MPVVLVTCGSCQTVIDNPLGHAFCSACGGQVHQQAPGALGEAPDDTAVRGKTLSIVAVAFAGAGLAAFFAFGLVGFILGVWTLVRGTARGSTWRTLAIVAVVAGALTSALGLFALMFLGILPAI